MRTGGARAAGPDEPEDVEWTFAAMPDSPSAQRLKIELLLRHGDTESADALIARGLLQRPTDAGLTLLRARSLFAQGKLDRARRELRLVLAKRPHHRGAIELAGHVALELGDGSESWSGMATAVIGGLTTATILTLVVVPTMYTVFARKTVPASETSS